ncbi:MAG TPA: AcvB/VirJ family lysyl-phosphatidylglycerol hydrolase [Pseudomonadales bacterium]|nr:AcvB/VirJ family lysyl-phosphatidylglycerol hydrolase [Pseudomonadales bacterium]
MRLKFFIAAGFLVLSGLLLCRYVQNESAAAQQPAAAVVMPFADLGETRVFGRGQNGLVILLADKPSMQRAVSVAQVLAASGKVAAIVDIDLYFSHVSDEHPACFDATTLLDVYAQHVQQELQFSHFYKPGLLGFGRAAPYLKLLLAQSPAGVFSAGISVTYDAPLLLPAAPCGAVADTLHWQSAGSPVVLPELVQQATPWQESRGWFTRQVLSQLDALALHAASAQTANNDDVSHLPLVELPRVDGGTAPYMAVVISGDGGWANIDKDIGEALGKQGVAVVGLNSLRYFWEEKSPDVAAADLSRIVRHYQHTWHKQRVVLIGFSLGADVLPFMVSRMPVELQNAVAGMVLLSPSQSVDFQFHISDWMQSGNNTSLYQLQPEMQKLVRLPVLCVYGAEDDEGLCPLLKARDKIKIAQLPGDHHYDGDYATVTRLILAFFTSVPTEKTP